MWGVGGVVISFVVAISGADNEWWRLLLFWSVALFLLSLTKINFDKFKVRMKAIFIHHKLKLLVVLIMFPVLVLISPVVFILIKMSAVFKKDDKIVQAQKNISSRLEQKYFSARYRKKIVVYAGSRHDDRIFSLDFTLTDNLETV